MYELSLYVHVLMWMLKQKFDQFDRWNLNIARIANAVQVTIWLIVVIVVIVVIAVIVGSDC